MTTEYSVVLWDQAQRKQLDFHAISMKRWMISCEHWRFILAVRDDPPTVSALSPLVFALMVPISGSRIFFFCAA